MAANLFGTPALKYFLYKNLTEQDFHNNPEHLDNFLQLDDADVMVSIKMWQTHDDKVLSQVV